ncbi:MAG: UDP-N-acetylmuramate--L-alanine ligase [Candidatus Marinimicrobia bacterium]|nr:UDP-N-acetylmuramate--L-alanine ligase [Candidatus Neomarinimicrobiota bacterium]|tara:strand:- start:15634 stop:17028 length:1395 start_codon:yes stop_codon:yes gene_type:complete
MNKIFGKTKHIHFIGIGGIGMSGMAELLYNHKFSISGSDINASERTKHLESIGIKIYKKHDQNNVKQSDLIVYSSAVKPNNPEIIEGKMKNIPIVKRAELLGEIIKIKQISLAISGTHGKTTTTSMVGNILYESKLDPTIIAGGIVNKYESNNISGSGEVIVVEADEFDKSFLSLAPTYIALNNMELEHLDIYKDLDDLKKSFTEFANSTPFYGSVCIGTDSKELKNIIPNINRNCKTFGIHNKADLMAKNITFNKSNTTFDVIENGKKICSIKLIIPGLHNVYNALCAISISMEIDIPIKYIIEGLNKFCGVKRRFQIKHKSINNKDIMIIDDYAHHHTELSATIQAAKAGWPNRKITTIFQPHLFSRTQSFYKDFAKSLMEADTNIIAPIYPAREKPIKNISSRLIVEELKNAGHKRTYDCKGKKQIPELVKQSINDNDIIIFMGAGDIYKLIEPTYNKLNE